MQPLAEEAVEVGEHRVALPLLVVARLDDDALQRDPVVGGPFHQHRIAPSELVQPGVYLGDLVGVSEPEIAHPQVGELVVVLAGEQQPIGVLRLRHEPVLLLLGEQRLQVRCSGAGAVEAVAFVRLVEGDQVDPAVGAEGVGFRIHLQHPEHAPLRSTLSAGDVQRLAAIGGEAPDIVLLVDEHRAIVLNPAAGPVARRRLRVVVVHIGERDGQVGGEVPRRAAAHIVQVPVAILVIGEVTTLG